MLEHNKSSYILKLSQEFRRDKNNYRTLVNATCNHTFHSNYTFTITNNSAISEKRNMNLFHHSILIFKHTKFSKPYSNSQHLKFQVHFNGFLRILKLVE